MDNETVTQFADKVMAQIIEDVRSGVVPWTVTDFGQLHDWTDANMYLEYAGQQFDANNQDSIDEVAAIEDEVSQRLANGVLTGGGWRRVTWVVQQTHSMVLPLALLRPHEQDGPLTVQQVSHDAVAEFEGDTNRVSSGARTITRLEAADAPPYVEPPRRASILDDPRVKLRLAESQLRDVYARATQLSDHGHHHGFDGEQDEITGSRAIPASLDGNPIVAWIPTVGTADSAVVVSYRSIPDGDHGRYVVATVQRQPGQSGRYSIVGRVSEVEDLGDATLEAIALAEQEDIRPAEGDDERDALG